MSKSRYSVHTNHWPKKQGKGKGMGWLILAPQGTRYYETKVKATKCSNILKGLERDGVSCDDFNILDHNCTPLQVGDYIEPVYADYKVPRVGAKIIRFTQNNVFLKWPETVILGKTHIKTSFVSPHFVRKVA